MIITRKAFAYITNHDRLLVFDHPDFLDAGIQVPAGTMRDVEEPEAAVLREAHEETGLDGLILAGFLGVHHREMSDYGMQAIHERHFYHLIHEGETPDEWLHWESDPDDGGAPIKFRLYWVHLPDEVPELIAEHGKFLPDLIAAIATVAEGGQSGPSEAKLNA